MVKRFFSLIQIDSHYRGNLENGLPNGTGELVWQRSGQRYCGEFKNGHRDGTGTMYYSECSCYKGAWRDGQQHGFGIMKFSTELVYEGFWEYGKPCGEGTMRWLDRDEVYSGEWLDGLQHGFGYHEWFVRRIKHSQFPYRNTYEGQWKQGVKHGEGILVLPNGTRLYGNWSADKLHGKCRIIHKNGFTIEAEFDSDVCTKINTSIETLEELTPELLFFLKSGKENEQRDRSSHKLESTDVHLLPSLSEAFPRRLRLKEPRDVVLENVNSS
ncbi:Alsin [Cichlidogyrus casuarinus]|uniref:Alsin n=1 Tax=Cichlidogyrus casuarinus TaxID=1844966 RepID=A0ABD2Q345_9PLAT